MKKKPVFIKILKEITTMKNLIEIEPIAVKDKNDVVKALTILEKIGIYRMSDEQKEKYLLDDTRTVENNFMIQEDDGGFRIQSHYLGFGISIENLEKQVNDILKKHPNISEKLKEIKDIEDELRKEIKDKEDRFIKEIENIKQKLTEEISTNRKSVPIITIKE